MENIFRATESFYRQLIKEGFTQHETGSKRDVKYFTYPNKKQIKVDCPTGRIALLNANGIVEQSGRSLKRTDLDKFMQ